MANIYAVTVTMYVEAADKKTAAGVAELNTFVATTAIRKSNSGWVQDKKTLLTTVSNPIRVEVVPDIEPYKKEPLVRAFGEKRAIALLNTKINTIYD